MRSSDHVTKWYIKAVRQLGSFLQRAVLRRVQVKNTASAIKVRLLYMGLTRERSVCTARSKAVIQQYTVSRLRGRPMIHGQLFKMSTSERSACIERTASIHRGRSLAQRRSRLATLSSSWVVGQAVVRSAWIRLTHWVQQLKDCRSYFLSWINLSLPIAA